MKKLKEKLARWLSKRKLNLLLRAQLVLRDNLERRYLEPGPKTCARFRPFETIRLALAAVYGTDWEPRLQINCIDIDEDREAITVRLYTPRPGMVIGKMGGLVNELEQTLSRTFRKTTTVRLTETGRSFGFDYVGLY